MLCEGQSDYSLLAEPIIAEVYEIIQLERVESADVVAEVGF